MTRARTLARELALQSLYQMDLRGGDAPPPLPEDADEESRAYARELIAGVKERDAELVGTLKTLVEHWSWERIAAVDRCILKIGAFELLHAPGIPPKVALDEAIELAKRYSTKESGAFVNGILDRLYQKSKGQAASS